MRELASDNQSGAAEILAQAAELFSQLRAVHLKEKTLDLVIQLCAELTRTHPDMAPLTNLANAVVESVISITPNKNLVIASEEAAKEFIEQAKRNTERASSIAAELIQGGTTVLTHSRSSTVLAAFMQAKHAGNSFNVIATESRPVMEGRALANSLACAEINVTLIADMAAAALIDKADFVLVGADRLTPGFLTNKIGTRMIALAARERGLPIYAICDSSKFISYMPSLPDERRDADELWPDAPRGVRIVNRYFEQTPLDYFTALISETGLIDPDEASKRAVTAKVHPLLKSAIKNLESDEC